jgi:hypothetical protein
MSMFRKKTIKFIERERIITIMKANLNVKTNNPNFTKVNNLTGVDRKTLKRWWDKREEYASSKYKNSAEKLTSEKFKGKYPQMEDNILKMRMMMMKMTMTMKKSIVKLPKK